MAAEEEGEVGVGAGVMQPCLVEGDVVADCRAAAADEHVAVRQNDGVGVVEDLLDGVVLAAETDDRDPGRPFALAENLQVGVAAGVVVSVIGGLYGRVVEVEGIADIDAAALERLRANRTVIGGRERRRDGMGGRDMDMDGEEDEEEDGETWYW